MGNANLCKESPTATELPTKVKNQPISGKGGVFQLPADCKVRVCVVAYDYHGYGADAQVVPRLGCVRDGVRFAKMAKDSGAEVSQFFDRPDMNKGEKKQSLGFPTKEAVLEEMRRMGGQTSENDAFVFYFAGHGKRTARKVEEGEDVSMVFMEPNGTPSHLVDEEVAAVLTEAFLPSAHVLLITDCFQNGSLCDLSRPALAGRPIVHLAAIKDVKTIPTPARGKGKDHIPFKEVPSVFTASLLEAVEQMAEPDRAEETQEVGLVPAYNALLERLIDGETMEMKADLVCECTTKFDLDTFRWPLTPPPGWVATDPLDASKQQGLGMLACMG